MAAWFRGNPLGHNQQPTTPQHEHHTKTHPTSNSGHSCPHPSNQARLFAICTTNAGEGKPGSLRHAAALFMDQVWAAVTDTDNYGKKESI